jgi:hypothetical protein
MNGSTYYNTVLSTGAPFTILSGVTGLPYQITVKNLTAYASTSATARALESTLLLGTVNNPTPSTSTFGIEGSTVTPVTSFSVAPTAGGIALINQSLPALPTAAPVSISSISQANPAVVTTATAHGFVTGQTVWINSATNMAQISQMPFTITVTSTTTFTLDYLDSSTFASAASGGTCTGYINWGGSFSPFTNAITSMTRSGSDVLVQFSVRQTLRPNQMFQFSIPPLYSGFQGMNYRNSGLLPTNQGGYQVTAYDATTNTATFAVDGFVGSDTFAFPSQAQITALGAKAYSPAQISTAGDYWNSSQPSSIAYQNTGYSFIYIGTKVCGLAGDYIQITYNWTPNA